MTHYELTITKFVNGEEISSKVFFPSLHVFEPHMRALGVIRPLRPDTLYPISDDAGNVVVTYSFEEIHR